MSKVFLGIDGGASSAKWCVVNESGEKVFEGKSGPIDGHVYRAESRERLSLLLREIRSSIPSEICAAHVGLTGSPESTDNQIELKTLFGETLGVIRLTVENDVHLGYRATYGTDCGLFLYAGTGSILVYRGNDGEINRIGGWGYLLGDEGAGYWIGREAIRETLSAMEEGRISGLSDFVFEASGGNSWDKIKRFVYSNSREKIAELAHPVLQAAETGEVDARQVAIRAGLELAGLVKRVERVLNKRNYPITFSGGIAFASSIVKEVVEEEVGREVGLFSGDTAFTAANLARSNF